MFDDERPRRIKQTLWVASFDDERLSCARCNEQVFARDVAFYTRIAPGSAFDPWCVDCATVFVHWAGAGALLESAADDIAKGGVVMEVLKRGDR